MNHRIWQGIALFIGVPLLWTILSFGICILLDASSDLSLVSAIWLAGLFCIGCMLAIQAYTKSQVRDEFRDFFKASKAPMLVFNLKGLAEWADARGIPTVENYEQYLRVRRPLCDEILDAAELVAINPSALKFFGAKTLAELEDRQAEIFLSECMARYCSAFLQAARAVQPGEMVLEIGTFHQNPIRLIVAEWMILTPSMPSKGGLIVYLFDISDRQRAEQALVESERKMRGFMRAVPAGLSVISADRRFLMVNERLCEMTQYTSDELIGVSTRLLYDDEAEFARVGAAMRVGVSSLESITIQSTFRRKNGEVRDAIFSISLLDAKNPDAGLICTVQDTTDMKRTELDRQQLQLQLIHAQKLESIGRIVSGLAHDFQGILLAMRIQIDLLRERENLQESDRKLFTELSSECKRGIEMSKRMLSFGRRESPSFEVIDIREQITSLLPIMKRMLGPSVELRFDAPEACFRVRGDPLMLDQVLLNLCSNARDAMPEGGQFLVGLSKMEPPQEPSLELQLPGRHVEIRVSDSGVGIRPENLQYVFEPFFTTKAKGFGTGLGLMIVDNVVRMHGGRIFVSSTMNKGTEFRILIPERSQEVVSGRLKVSGL